MIPAGIAHLNPRLANMDGYNLSHFEFQRIFLLGWCVKPSMWAQGTASWSHTEELVLRKHIGGAATALRIYYLILALAAWGWVGGFYLPSGRLW